MTVEQSAKAKPLRRGERKGGSATRIDITIPKDFWDPDRYPRRCRHGHLITGPHQEIGWDNEGLASHGLQCLQCRLHSQGVAWCRWAFRRWLWSLGWGDADMGKGGGLHAAKGPNAIVRAHEIAWDAYVAKADAGCVAGAARRAAKAAYRKALRAADIDPKKAPAWEPTRYGVIR